MPYCTQPTKRHAYLPFCRYLAFNIGIRLIVQRDASMSDFVESIEKVGFLRIISVLAQDIL